MGQLLCVGGGSGDPEEIIGDVCACVVWNMWEGKFYGLGVRSGERR